MKHAAPVIAAVLMAASPAAGQTAPSGSSITADLNRAPAGQSSTPPAAQTSAPASQTAPRATTPPPAAAPAPAQTPASRPGVPPTSAPASATARPTPAPQATTPAAAEAEPAQSPTEPPPPPPLTPAQIATLPFRLGMPAGFRIVEGRSNDSFDIWTVRRAEGPAFITIYAGPRSDYPLYAGREVTVGGRTSIVVDEGGAQRAMEHIYLRAEPPREIHIWVGSVDDADRAMAEAIAQSVEPR